MVEALTQLSTFKTALEAFRSDTGSYPEGTNGLLDLVRRPIGLTNWNGPYLDDLPADPWGHAYVYACPGAHSAAGYPYDLSSPGPPDTNAIVANWLLERMKP